MNARALLAPVCAVACVLGAIAWSADARAYPGYPDVVDQWLGADGGLIQAIDKPMGCQLCHVSDQGDTVELKAFPNLLVASYGLTKTAEQDAELMGALAGLKAANPMLYSDMQRGIDPNTDPALTSQALPQPEYGCSAGTADRRDGPSWVALLAFLPLAGALRRSRRLSRRA
ncbi:MAG TPA: hypothetical protein VK762_16845 [Polyangiaceae bacterium]|jgi:hypothetical protein|nr:hypothetical protein [Polyangiaceae bacterium]